jgi:hypothetical protein
LQASVENNGHHGNHKNPLFQPMMRRLNPSQNLHSIIHLSVTYLPYLPTYLPVYLSVCSSTCLSVYLSVCLTIYLSVLLSICLSACLPTYVPIYVLVKTFLGKTAALSTNIEPYKHFSLVIFFAKLPQIIALGNTDFYGSKTQEGQRGFFSLIYLL